MTNKDYNGFASKEQYLAVKKEIENAITNLDDLGTFMVTYDEDSDYINVIADGLTFDIDITELTIKHIGCGYCMDMYEVNMVQDVFNVLGRVNSAFIKYDGKEDRTYELKSRVVKL